MRHTDDGALEFIGKRPQIKLRGYRTVGESSAILRQSDVSAAVVVAREDTPNIRVVA